MSYSTYAWSVMPKLPRKEVLQGWAATLGLPNCPWSSIFSPGFNMKTMSQYSGTANFLLSSDGKLTIIKQLIYRRVVPFRDALKDLFPLYGGSFICASRWIFSLHLSFVKCHDWFSLHEYGHPPRCCYMSLVALCDSVSLSFSCSSRCFKRCSLTHIAHIYLIYNIFLYIIYSS